MAMPKGKKIAGGYATIASIPGADDYKMIAKKCTESGHKMGSSSARNIFLGAMMKIADGLQKSQGNTYNNKQLYAIARSPAFQAGVAEVLNGE